MTTATTGDFSYLTSEWGKFFPTIEPWTWTPIKRHSQHAVSLAKRYTHRGSHRAGDRNLVQFFKHWATKLGVAAFMLYHYAVVALVLRGGDTESRQLFWYAVSLVCVAGSAGMMWVATRIAYNAKQQRRGHGHHVGRPGPASGVRSGSTAVIA